MKKLFFFVLVIFTIHSIHAQEAVFERELDTFEITGKVTVKNTPKSILYQRGFSWLKQTYKNADSVITRQDKFKGIIEGNAIITYKPENFSGSETVTGIITYTLKLKFEDNAYTYTLTNFQHKPSGGAHNAISFGLITTNTLYHKEIKGTSEKWRNYVWSDLRKQTQQRAKLIIDNLDENMHKSFTRRSVQSN